MHTLSRCVRCYIMMLTVLCMLMSVRIRIYMCTHACFHHRTHVNAVYALSRHVRCCFHVNV